MKIICNVDLEKSNHTKFQPYKSVVEVAKGKNYEVKVVIEKDYSDNQWIEIISGPVRFHVNSLKILCGWVCVSEVLLHVEICKFVFDTYPELAAIKLGK